MHYDNGKPVAYGEKYLLNSTDFNGLKWSYRKIKKAFKKPILDADNNLKKWKGNKKNEK